MDGTAESREGTQFGPYRLRRLVGRGGMGDVYEAEDTVRERIVALKLMSETLSSDPVFRTRMQREARTAGRLQEPHVVPIHDFGEIDGQLYVDMRLINGVDLAAMLRRQGPLAPPRASRSCARSARRSTPRTLPGQRIATSNRRTFWLARMTSPILSISGSPAPPPTKS